VHQSTTSWSINFGDLFLWIYLGISFFLLLKFLGRLIELTRIIQESQKIKSGDYKTLIHPEMPVSSFFSYLFWKTEKGQDDHLILAHEQIHIKELHSVDLMAMELIQVLFWINPIINKIKTQLSITHEYLADWQVTQRHQNNVRYQRLLLSQVQTTAILGHQFAAFIIKRMTMLGRRRSSRLSYLYYLLAVPTLIGLALILAAPTDDSIFSKVYDKINNWQSSTFQINRNILVTDENSVFVDWGNITSSVSESTVHLPLRFHTIEQISKQELLPLLTKVISISRQQGFKKMKVLPASISFTYSP